VVNACRVTAMYCVCLPGLVLIAQVIFLLECRHTLQTYRHAATDANDHTTYASAHAGIGNYYTVCLWCNNNIICLLPLLLCYC